MSMNLSPAGVRKHIAFFGSRNAGKSSLVNAITGQSRSVVSDTPGTTTDPVKTSMELLPLGPVVLIDTPGADDTGALGEARVEQTMRALDTAELAVLVADVTIGLSDTDRGLLAEIKKRRLPCVIAYNKSDLSDTTETADETDIPHVFVSAKTGEGLEKLKAALIKAGETAEQTGPLVADLVAPGDTLVLVVPIDASAPKGRLILPQQQVIRDALEAGALPIVCRDTELSSALTALKEPPRMVITDSQVFGKVAKTVPQNITLTSFSILMARFKGNLVPSVEGASVLKSIKDGDRILIAEGCTHHRQCEDIGTVKLPAWIREFTGVTPEFSFSSGAEFPADLSGFRLVIHCGACMQNPAEAQSRYARAKAQGVPITNYGIAIAYMKGILKRSLSPFSDLPPIP